MTIVAPFLMFEGRAEEAMTFYARVVPDSRVVRLQRHGPDGPGPEGTVIVGEAVLGGLTVMCSDSYVQHAFGFTPALSLFMTCTSEQELDALAEVLATEGEVLMPSGDYGFSRRFAWVNDQFGVSWQLSVV
jgi:predicted 3-demethylubiquinone-9 3-methyltransferase (glyoxalase superfamily)